MKNDGDPSPLVEIYLRVCVQEIGFIKSILESYDCVGIIRTVDRDRGIIVAMVASDFVSEAWHILESIRGETKWTQISPPDNLADDWLMKEIHPADD